MHAQIQKAQSGEDQASHDTQLMITHLGGLPITNAAPLVISPAAGVLFIGAPASTAEGGAIHVTLAFDHRILNGVAAARFLTEIGRRLDQLLEDNDARPERPVKVSAGTGAGEDLRNVLQAAPAGQRRRLLENHVGRMVASLLKIDAAEVDFGQPLRNQGLDSLEGSELAFSLERALAIPVPPTLVWNHPTITAIASHLLERLGMRIADASLVSNGGSVPVALLSEIEQLTDEQVKALLGSLPDTPGTTR
jgi:acyl carrier protein